MKVCEIFLSIQGESSYSGLPCIFIRLSGCNLACTWCDSRYALDEQQEMTIDEIVEAVSEFKPVDLIEITGGEPLIQTDTPLLMDTLDRMGYKILLETNGSISIGSLPADVIKIVDVKCPSSGEEESFNRQNLLYLDPSRDEIKFVIGDRNDYDFARNFIMYNNLWGYNLLFSTVYDKLEPKELVKWVLDDKLSVRYQLQMHKYIWDPHKRGV